MAEKVTTMVLNVDLQCCRCYKKVKKVLSKFPQIRDQMYDKQANTVTITVVCCSPEEIRDKICCKGGECIKSIEIKPPPKPKKKPPEPDPKPAKPEMKPEQNHTPTVTVVCCSPEEIKDKICCKCGDCIKSIEIKPPPKPKEPEKKPPEPKKLDEKCEPTGTSIGSCCTECYHGHDGGPCYLDGPPPPSRPCYGRPVYDRCGCGCGRGCDCGGGCSCGCCRGCNCGGGCSCVCGRGCGCGGGRGCCCGCGCDGHQYCYASKENPQACSFM